MRMTKRVSRKRRENMAEVVGVVDHVNNKEATQTHSGVPLPYP